MEKGVSGADSTGSLSGRNTNAPWKDGGNMREMRISSERAATRAKRDLLSSAVLERCRAFYEDPENEKAFQEWKSGKEAEE